MYNSVIPIWHFSTNPKISDISMAHDLMIVSFEQIGMPALSRVASLDEERAGDRYVMSTGQILIQAEVAMDKSWKQNWKPKFVLSTTRLQIKFHFIWLWGSSEKDSPFEMTFECLMMTFWRFFVVCNKNVSFSCKILLLHKPTDLEFHYMEPPDIKF